MMTSSKTIRAAAMGITAAGLLALAPNAATAGDPNGNFMARVGVTGVITQDSLEALNSNLLGDLKAAGFDAEVSDEVIPTLTLTYFLNRNIAVELFCCFAKHQLDLDAGPGFAALSGEIGDFWIFPPALTVQYHFDPMGAFKPYVGVGAQYIKFFNEDTGANSLNSTSIDFDDALGVTIQAGIDVSLGGGWYLNADIKKTWLDTDVTWRNAAGIAGHTVKADADVDPLIISAALGYRFNLEDLFGGAK